MKHRHLFLASLLIGTFALALGIGHPVSAQAATAKVTPNLSSVVTSTVYSKKLHLDWNYDVYLPAGYDPSSSKRYPVLYMLHGLYGNHRNLLERFNSQQMLDGIEHRTNKAMIVVFVDGFNSFYVNQKGGPQVESAIIHDLIPTINKNYKISNSVSKHAIGGISMGGSGAARIALKYPNLFSKAVLISPAVWYSLPKDNPIRMNMHAFTDGNVSWSTKRYKALFPTQYMNDASKGVKLYIESTSSDTTVPIKNVTHFVKDAKAAGNSTKFIRDSGDNHNWVYWAKAAPKAYNWAINEMN